MSMASTQAPWLMNSDRPRFIGMIQKFWIYDESTGTILKIPLRKYWKIYHPQELLPWRSS